MDTDADTPAERDERNARHQNSFRHTNEAITRVSGGLGLGGDGEAPMEVLCECGRPDCAERIELSTAAYEQIRSDGTHFVLVPGHEVESVERVIARRPTYVVAENVNRAADIARGADPRLTA